MTSSDGAVRYAERMKRIMDAVELQQPDRVPTVFFSMFWLARYGGITYREAMYDYDRVSEITRRALLELQPDVFSLPHLLLALGPVMERMGYKQLQWPGHGTDENASYQYLDREYMKPEEYDDYLLDPTGYYLSKYLPRVGEAFEGFEELPTFPGLYYIRLLVAAREFARSGIVRAFTALQKAGEEAQRLTDYAESFRIENDLVPVPLWEGDCTTRLETLADIPRGKAVYWFERTDLVKAKEVLGDVVCLRGNVPASMLTTGTPEQVDAYCRMLIEKVGKGGGFILDGAIGIPDESKPENVTAMFEAARKYVP